MAADAHPSWIVPAWPVSGRVKSLFTTRHGGASRAPFDSFNVGPFVGDDPLSVSANIAQLAAICGQKLIFNHQMHGFAVHRLAPGSPGLAPFDASFSALGQVCTATAADCCPVLFALDHPGLAQPVVAAAHAGWRGLCGDASGGILDAVLKEYWHFASVFKHFDATKMIANHLHVWLGPCIGPKRFEVGPEVRQAFASHHAADSAHFCATRSGKFLADLPALARARLARGGVKHLHGNDGTDPWCTVGNPERFFSHRRDGAGGTGRMCAMVWAG